MTARVCIVCTSGYALTGLHVDEVVFAEDFARNRVFGIIISAAAQGGSAYDLVYVRPAIAAADASLLVHAHSLEVLLDQFLLVHIARLDRHHRMEGGIPRDCTRTAGVRQHTPTCPCTLRLPPLTCTEHGSVFLGGTSWKLEEPQTFALSFGYGDEMDGDGGQEAAKARELLTMHVS